MKKLLFSILLLVVILGCQNDDFVIGDQGQSMAKEAYSKFSNQIKAEITVFPSWDQSGVTDTDNIESALNSLSTGGIVLLEEGTFYVNRTIVAPGFNGTLRGVSMAKTEIIAVGSNDTPFLNDYINSTDGPFLVYAGTLFFFPNPDASVSVSNLSASLIDGFVTEDNDWGINSLISFIMVYSDDQSDTHFDHLKLTGGYTTNPDPIFAIQPVYGIAVLGNGSSFPSFTTGGNHTISNSEISLIGIQATLHQLMKNANIEIFGNSLHGVKQVITRFVDGCDILFDKNNIDAESFGTIVVTQEYAPIPGSSNTVKIRRNKVHTAGYSPIEIGPTFNTANFNLMIENNKLTNQGADPLGWFDNTAGILIDQGNDGAVVRDNIIRGTSLFGIIQASNDGWIVDNNMQGLTPVISDYLLFGNNNMVTDGGNSTYTDNGTGNILNIGDGSKVAVGKTESFGRESLIRRSPTLMDLLPDSKANQFQLYNKN